MSKRDIGQELLDGIRAIKRGEGREFSLDLPSDIKELRSNLDLSQTAFAAFLGVSTRTLQDWEQGRRKPQGAALSLLKIADQHPEAFLHH